MGLPLRHARRSSANQVSDLKRGDLTTDGHDYPGIYYSQDALDFTLWGNIESRKWVYYLKNNGRSGHS